MRVYLIDLCWHMYRSYYTFSHFSSVVNGFEKPTGHIFGVLSTIEALLKKDPKATIYLCEDGKPIGKSLNPNYKAGRKSLEYNIMQDKELIEKLAIYDARVKVAYNNEAEADQVMFTLAERLHSTCEVVIFSGDDDMLQALKFDNVSILRSTEKGQEVYITRDDYYDRESKFYKKYHGCPVELLPVYRAIVGDTSDNLRGIERIPRELVLKLVNYVDLSKTRPTYLNGALLRTSITRTQVKYLEALDVEWQKIHMNYVIMKLTSCPVYKKDFGGNFAEVKALAEELQLKKWSRFTGLVDFK